MKLTNNKLEKLIMEVLTESTGQEYEVDGNNFTLEPGVTFKDFKDMLDGSDIDVIKMKKVRVMTGLELKPARAIVRAYVDDKKPINVAKPKAFELKKFNDLLDDIMTAADGIDQDVVNAAKQAFTAYYKQFTQEAQGAVKADTDLQQRIVDANAAKAKFNFAQLQAEINKVAAATDLSGLKQAETELTSYYTANKADVDADTSEKAKYDAAIDSITAKRAQLQNDAFKKIIDNAEAIAANTGSSESTLRNTKASLDNKKTNDNDFAAYVTANQGEYDSVITNLDNAINLIVNKWKLPDEAIGIETPADIKNNTKTHTDPDRNEILKALQNSFGNLMSQPELIKIAQITEGKERFLTEDTNTLELADIEAYIDDLLSKDPKALNATQKAQHATDLALADKIDQALKDYINQVRDPARATKLKKAKRDYDALLVKQRGLERAKYTKYAASDRLPTATTIGGTKQKSPVDPIVVDSFMTFFKDHHTIQEKIEFLSDFSDAVAKAATGNVTDLNNSTKFPAEKVIVGGNILNMMSKATRQFDSSAGGLVIEALLAFMVSGEKIGQAGGAADFKDSNGKLYSSKWGQKSKTQSISNFSNIGEVITYVSAYKYQTNDTPKGVSGEKLLSETIYIHEVDVAIYDVFTVVPYDTIYKGKVGDYASVKLQTGKSSFTSTQIKNLKGVKADLGSQKDKNGNKTHFNVSTDKMVDANGDSFLTTYKIKFVGAETQIFDDIFSEAVEKQSSDLVKAVARLNSLSKSLEEQATSYTVTGDFSDAVSLANSHKDIRKQIETIYLEKEGPSSGANITDIGLTESKLQTLDQLIAETMRDIKRKRKK